METRKVTSLLASCKKHTKHQQSPGVCSICLRERLSKISGSSLQVVSSTSLSSSASTISSVSSVCSSNVSSNMASPMHKSNHDHLEGKGYFSFLRKSRSMAYVNEKIVKNDVKKKKGDGFWTKLIGIKRTNIIVHKGSPRLMHSRTMREMLTTRV
ncbi:uncharacterized protein [Rutidosis leptorrhynchoides]|uniref:uncharacterized protein n=1 Tax=Rutidosis leptorrhynchoides TaxID=125765 RepID=UPI003A9A2BFB